MPHWYLHNWEWAGIGPDALWQSPGGNAVAALDLRSLPQQSIAGGIPEGYGLFGYAAPQVRLLAYLGQSPEDNLTLAQKAALKQLWGANRDWVVPDKLGQAIFAALITQADSTGQSRVKPIRGYGGRQLTLRLAGQVFGDIRCARGGLEELATLAVFKADYRQNRLLVDVGKLPLDALQKYTGWMCLRLRVTSDEILPPEYVRDGSKPPKTSISDNFNRADQSLNALGTWVERVNDWSVASNVAITAGGDNGLAHHTTALSSDDHEAQVDMTVFSLGAGPACRISTVALTCYELRIVATTGTNLYFYKRVADVRTIIDAGRAVTVSLPDTLKIYVDGSTMRSYFNGGLEHDFTDSAVTGNLNAGMNCRGTDDLDNFEAADLAAGGGISIPVVMHHLQQQGIA